jgi:hypothetical protein
MRSPNQGRIASLTSSELTATAKYLDGAPKLACSAAIKQSSNLMAITITTRPGPDAS